MNLIKKYVDYLTDNPDHKRFKRKLYGWGWTPATREGWLVILAFLAIILWIAASHSRMSDQNNLFWFFVKLAIAVVSLITICVIKGEKPHWQWEIPRKD